jgi:hypothetical protein
MIKKFALLAMGLTLFLLCSCLATDDFIENETNFVTDSVSDEETSSDAVSASHEELEETADYKEEDSEMNEVTIPTSNTAEEEQEPSLPQEEQPIIDPCKEWCLGCEPLDIDGEHIPRCGITTKYTFFFNTDISILTDEGDGVIVDNWWRPDDTRPSRGVSSDRSLGSFFIQNDRVFLEITDGEEYLDWALDRISPPRFVHELTTTQWDELGVQIFQYAGDVTIIGLQGTLSQMPELQEDDFDSRLCIGDGQDAGGRELLYIFYHELPESKLWNRLMYNS